MATIKMPVDLGAAVRRARTRARLTQTQLAAASGVGLRFIVELEAGKPTIQLGKALTVAQSLGLTLSVQDHNQSADT